MTLDSLTEIFAQQFRGVRNICGSSYERFPKFGNDEPVDRLAVGITDLHLPDRLEKHRNGRGGAFLGSAVLQ